MVPAPADGHGAASPGQDGLRLVMPAIGDGSRRRPGAMIPGAAAVELLMAAGMASEEILACMVVEGVGVPNVAAHRLDALVP